MASRFLVNYLKSLIHVDLTENVGELIARDGIGDAAPITIGRFKRELAELWPCRRRDAEGEGPYPRTC